MAYVRGVAELIRAYLREHNEDGYALQPWTETGRRFGVSYEAVRQQAVRVGVKAKPVKPLTVAVCPDCGARRELEAWRGAVEVRTRCAACRAPQPLQLVCDACGGAFERTGEAKHSHLTNRRRFGTVVVICPSCRVGTNTRVLLREVKARRETA